MSNIWNGTPMQQGTMLKLYSELCRVYGKDRTRLAVEVQPNAILKTIDNEQDAQTTIDNLLRAEGEKQ